ncbi:MAG: NAD-dependent epimerase/dehydratase family protein [Acidobacteriota bacterium]|nr:NAD-dependent epimerase/dehydratase family protein [Acidobacteriota bacterium]
MAVLVTGASGFLGGRLAQALAARGEDVRILARAHNDLRHLAGFPVEVIEGSLSDPDALKQAVRNVTHVYHCAACSTDWAPWKVYYEANVAGARNLLRAAFESTGLRRFLHVSTTDVYGYPRAPCDESHPMVHAELPYNRTKCLGEESVWEASRDGLPVTVVRPATIYGPRGKAFATDIAKLIRQGLMAVIDGGRSPGGFCYVDNAVDAVIEAAAAPVTEGRVYNVSDGTGATWRGYVDALAGGINEKRPWIDLPSAIAYPLARALEMPYRFTRIPGRPLLTRHAVLLLSRDQEYPIASARRDFGFSPAVSFEEGVARTVEWLNTSTG